MIDPESDALRAMTEMWIPPPITADEVRDLENAFSGDYQNRTFETFDHGSGENETDVHNEKVGKINNDNADRQRSIILLPLAKDFEQRADSMDNLDNLHIDSRKRRYRFLVPFMLKAEMHPGLAFGECMLTFVNALCGKFNLLLLSNVRLDIQEQRGIWCQKHQLVSPN
jgi:hypothetical protein